MNIRQIPCYVCAYEEDGKVMELRFEPVGEKSSLGNIYVGQIENIAANIGAAFVQISAGEKCYLQLSDAPNAIYASVKKGDRPLKAGDEILVQISREAMKGKLPAVTTNLNFTGKYLVLTTGDKQFGLFLPAFIQGSGHSSSKEPETDTQSQNCQKSCAGECKSL